MSKRSANDINALKRLVRQFALLELKYKFAKEDGRKLDCDRLSKSAGHIAQRVEHLKAAMEHRAQMDALAATEQEENKRLELETLMVETDYVVRHLAFLFGEEVF
jgi:hypothetical protein